MSNVSQFKHIMTDYDIGLIIDAAYHEKDISGQMSKKNISRAFAKDSIGSFIIVGSTRRVIIARKLIQRRISSSDYKLTTRQLYVDMSNVYYLPPQNIVLRSATVEPLKKNTIILSDTGKHITVPVFNGASIALTNKDNDSISVESRSVDHSREKTKKTRVEIQLFPKRRFTYVETYAISEEKETAKGYCPICNSPMIKKVYDLPVVTDNNSFAGYIGRKLWFCTACSRIYLTKRENQDISDALEYSKMRLVSPKEMPYSRVTSSKRENKYDQDNDKRDSLLTEIGDYLLTNKSCVDAMRCPLCGGTLKRKRFNVPVFDKQNCFVSYYLRRLYNCIKCQQSFMTEYEYTEIQKTLTLKNQYINPKNVRLQKKPRDTGYLYEPIFGYELCFERKETLKENKQIASLAQASFLATEGYNIRLNEADRHAILYDAVKKYGRRRVADHLRFLILTREGQSNGATKFANALRIWNSDLNYVVRLKKP